MKKKLLLLLSALGYSALFSTGCTDDSSTITVTPLCRCAASEVCVDDRCVPIAEDARILDAGEDAADVTTCSPVAARINELRITSATLPDFIEISAAPGASLDGYRVLATNAEGAQRVNAKLSGATVPESGLYVAALGDGLEVSPDIVLAPSGLSAPSGNVLLYDCQNRIVDAVGYGDFSGENARFRGEGAAAPSASDDQSVGRCFGADDTDDNAADFSVITPSPGAENACGDCGALTTCGGSCVDTQSDINHCGGCEQACTCGGTVCTNGSCELTCAAGQTACEQDGCPACIDLNTDTENCGGCGVACADGEFCSSGQCAGECSEGLTACGDACVDLDSNTENCGACGESCCTGSLCVAGSCELACPSGQTACSEADTCPFCVDTSTSAANCGACGNACADGELCVDGVCGGACELTECGSECVDTKSSDTHCGGCDSPCGENETCTDGACALDCGSLTECSGACVDTQDDDANCGSCGNACESNEVCVSGTCELDCGGQTACDGACVDTQTSTSHCGSCGNACDPALTCDTGVCACAAGTADCNTDLASDGCETDTTSSTANCGGCGVVCDVTNTQSVSCTSSVCVLNCSTNFDDCNNDPSDGCEANLRDSDTHCGACDAACPSGETCDQGRCR